MRTVPFLALLSFVACTTRDERPVAKRDTGVAESRVTTEVPAGRAPDSAGGVPAVPTDSAQRAAVAPRPSETVRRFDPPPESLKVKP